MDIEQIEKEAIGLMKLHGLIRKVPIITEVDLKDGRTAFVRGVNWKFKWSKAYRLGGSCNYFSRTIRLSKPIMRADPSQWREIMLHEIAHALVGPLVKPHGDEWKAKAVEIGCSGARTHSVHISRIDYLKGTYNYE